MSTNENFERLLKKFRHLEKIEQTPAVKLVREKVPNLIEKYQQMNKIEMTLKDMLQEYTKLLDQTKESLEVIEQLLSALLVEEKP